MDNLYGQIAEAIYAGDEAEAEKLAQAAIEAGVDLGRPSRRVESPGWTGSVWTTTTWWSSCRS